MVWGHPVSVPSPFLLEATPYLRVCLLPTSEVAPVVQATGINHPALIPSATVIRHVTNERGLLPELGACFQLNLNLGGSKAGPAVATCPQCQSLQILLRL